MSVFLLLVLSMTGPAELEAAGRLPEAGAAWAARNNLPGQVRVMTSMLEDALYSADTRRAWLLSGELEAMGVDPSLVRFWAGRIAWSAGLRAEASLILSELETDDPWLLSRARGLALLYGGDPRGAVTELARSLALAGSSRRGLWSGLDLCTALIASGETRKALEASEILSSLFPGEALARVMRGLCLQLSGAGARAARELASFSPGDPPGAASMAGRLLREFVE